MDGDRGITQEWMETEVLSCVADFEHTGVDGDGGIFNQVWPALCRQERMEMEVRTC